MINTLLSALGISSPGINLDPIVRQVTESCVSEVLDQVVGRIEGMSFSEARGYLRARSTKIVIRQTRVATAALGALTPDQWELIVHRATERLVPQVIRQARVGVPATNTLRMPALRQAA